MFTANMLKLIHTSSSVYRGSHIHTTGYGDGVRDGCRRGGGRWARDKNQRIGQTYELFP